VSRRRRILRPNRQFPHCPKPECRFHKPDPAWGYVKIGSFQRPSDRRTFARYRCLTCLRTFSYRTFAADYWLRRRDLLIPIANHAVNGPGLRQIARELETTHATVQRHISRAARHCLLFHHSQIQHRQIKERLVVDGFETFEFSQFFPFHFNLAAGADSTMLYFFTDSPLRRKGSMTAAQKKQRELLEETLGRPDPKAIRTGIRELLEPLRQRLTSLQLTVHTDDHPAYPPALEDLRKRDPRLEICHHVTSSRERRTMANPLFAVNYMDMLVRHSQANHRRETIAFSKRRQGAAERLAIFGVWKNWVKKWRENDRVTGPDRQPKEVKTAAMEAGMAQRRLTWREVFGRRLFVTHQDLPRSWTDYYWRKVKTASLGERQTEHHLRYAF